MILCSGLCAVLESYHSMIGILNKSNLIREKMIEAAAIITKEAAVSLFRV